ncbi:hypothetical protein PanWU01x14_074320, partial [Parasponia andersonii]
DETNPKRPVWSQTEAGIVAGGRISATPRTAFFFFSGDGELPGSREWHGAVLASFSGSSAAGRRRAAADRRSCGVRPREREREREREERDREREEREERERGEKKKVGTWPPFIGLCNFSKIAHKSPKFQISINLVPQNLQFSPSEQNFCKLVPTIFYPENW